MKASEWKRVFDLNFDEVEIPGTVRSNVRDCVANLEAYEKRIKELEAERDELIDDVKGYRNRAEKAESSLSALRSGLEPVIDELHMAITDAMLSRAKAVRMLRALIDGPAKRKE